MGSVGLIRHLTNLLNLIYKSGVSSAFVRSSWAALSK